CVGRCQHRAHRGVTGRWVTRSHGSMAPPLETVGPDRRMTQPTAPLRMTAHLKCSTNLQVDSCELTATAPEFFLEKAPQSDEIRNMPDDLLVVTGIGVRGT